MGKQIKIVFILLSVFSSSVFVASSASAIFGLSKCEKTKNKILKEEDIQKYAWKNYDKGRRISLVDGQINWQEYRENLYRLGLVLKSDVMVFETIRDSPSCFKPESVAAVREKIPELETFLTKLDSEIKMIDNTTLVVQQQMKASEAQKNYLISAHKNPPKSWLRILK